LNGLPETSKHEDGAGTKGIQIGVVKGRRHATMVMYKHTTDVLSRRLFFYGRGTLTADILESKITRHCRW